MQLSKNKNETAARVSLGTSQLTQLTAHSRLLGSRAILLINLLRIKNLFDQLAASTLRTNTSNSSPPSSSAAGFEDLQPVTASVT